jgi:hypothetical protein
MAYPSSALRYETGTPPRFRTLLAQFWRLARS